MKFNIEAELLKEHSKKQSAAIAKYIGANADRFGRLVSIFMKGPYRVTQRAAWPLSLCIEAHHELVYPYLKKIILFASKKDAHNAVKRNVVRLLQFVKIPKKHQGIAANLCFDFLKNRKESIAVRVFSMTVLTNLSNELPELKHELILLIEDALPFESAGFVSRGRKLLKILKA